MSGAQEGELCPHCGTEMFAGATVCRGCQAVRKLVVPSGQLMAIKGKWVAAMGIVSVAMVGSLYKFGFHLAIPVLGLPALYLCTFLFNQEVQRSRTSAVYYR